MDTQSQTVPVRFVNDLMATVMARRGPALRAAILACVVRADIPPALLDNPAARVTMEKFSAFYRLLAVEQDDETLCLFSRPLRGGTLKYLCHVMLDAENLGMALHRFIQLFGLLQDDFAFRLETGDGVASIVLQELGDLGPSRVLALELMLMLAQGVGSWMIDRRIPFVAIDLAYPAPGHERDYAHLYPGPTRFDQPRTALHMDTAWLREPIRQDKAALTVFLRNAPLGWFYVSVSERPCTYRVREYLKQHLETGNSVQDVARALHLSPRTLARRLEAEGTRFQAVKDGLRRDVAIAHLSKTDEPVALIGERLGFEDTTAFNRAFRQWTGSAPGAYRKRPAEQAAGKPVLCQVLLADAPRTDSLTAPRRGGRQ